jgi:hypothetical protein
MLIDNWKTSWKLWSSLAAILAGAFNAAAAANFYGLLDNLGPQGLAAINAVVGLIVIPVLRVLKQTADEQTPLPPIQPPAQGGYARPGVLLALAAALLIGCTQMGMVTPQTFNQKVAAAITSVTSVRQTATVLLNAGKISVDDARNVQAQADSAMSAVAIARQIADKDPAAGQTKLTAALTILQALDTYLATKGSKS